MSWWRRTLLGFALALSAQPCQAQNPVDRKFTALGPGGIAQGASVGAAGNLSASLPLALPSPRGALPLPFGVVYNGSNRVGAAGVGWDIPILGVTRQRNLSRRKPVHRFASQAEPVTAERVFVDIGVGPMLMTPTDTPGVFQPFANGYFELKAFYDTFVGHDAEGRTWVFQKLPALLDDDFFALVRIEDASGINRVELDYDVFDKFSPDPIVTPNPDQISARELLLRELRYSHDTRGACPKYSIRLHYSTSPTPQSLEFIRGRPRSRSHLLQAVELLSGRDTSCDPTGIRAEATYQIGYNSDPVTGQSRLTTVNMLGPPTNSPVHLASLPVVSYSYGTSINRGALNYTEAEHILLPAGPAGANRGFGATLGSGGGALYGRVRGFHDMNGDGRLDFVTLNATGTHPVIAINQPSALGNDFSTLPTPINLPSTAVGPYNIGAPDLSFGLPVLATIDNTYQQIIDFNGDGRPDIIVTTEGRNDAGQRDPNFWKVLINQPGPSGEASDITWLERHIDISALRSAVMQRHTLSLVASSDQNAKPLPIERTHQTGAFENNVVVESSVLTQWKLLDVNGDGFPDFVFDSEGITAHTENRCDAAGRCRPVVVQDHGDGARLMVIYHTGPMMAGAGAETQNVWRGPAVMLREDGACGVTRMAFTGGMRQMQCGFLDANGDGLVDYVVGDAAGHRVILSSGLAQAHDILLPDNRVPAEFAQQEAKRTIALPGPVGVLRDPRTLSCPSGVSGSHTYEVEQISELRDITGDGIADYIFFGGPQMPPGNTEGPQGWWFMAGTGTGFVAPRPIRAPPSIGFALHVSTERCDGASSNVIASLEDLDGDGRPEIVRSPNVMNVRVAKLSNPEGELGAPSAGQITAIDNRYGSVIQIRYGSAKSDWLGHQDVPYPQIVVAEMQQVAAFNLGTSLAPVRYAYGAPEQVYHPLLGRYVFKGFGRRIEIQGESATFDTVKGTVFVTSAARAVEFAESRDKLMLAGLTREVTVLAGTIAVDPRRFLNDSDSAPTVERLQTTWKRKDAPGAVPPLLPLEEECYETPPLTAPGQFGDLSLCRRVASAFVAETTRSEGPQPLPELSNIATRTLVTEVDGFGRPLHVQVEGDLRRADDDICLQTEYAVGVPGAPVVLNAPKLIVAHECGNLTRVLSATRFEYDGLPFGQVSVGRPSARIVERHNTATTQLVGSVPSARMTRDLFGNLIEVTRRSANGQTTTTRVAYDPFGLMPVRSEVTATGLAVPLVTETERQPYSLLPLTVTDANGASIHNRFDNFGRLTRVSLTKPDDPVRYILVDIALAGFNGAASGRSIRYKVFHEFIPEPQAASAPADSFTVYTSVLDEFARQMHGIVELGADYGDRSLIVDQVIYDALGRLRFSADPFPATAFGPRFGATFTYHPDGRVNCIIEGVGIQSSPTTDETLDRYPTCRTYSYSNGELLVRTRGPNEIAADKPQFDAFDEDAISATGLLLRRSRRQKGAAPLELAEYGYDRLGSLALLRRYAEPEASSTMAEWTWINDSVGGVLEAVEPANVRRRYAYDDWGSLTSVSWTDNTSVAPVERGVHFAYDGLARLTRTVESLNGQQQADTLQEYFYDLSSGQPQQLDTGFLTGRLSFARAGARSAFFGYDSLGRLTTVSHSQGGEGFAERAFLGADGQTKSVQVLTLGVGAPIQETQYAYDSARRLRSIAFSDTAGVSELWRALETDIFGHVLQSQRGNGAIERRTYRDGGRRELQSKRIEVGNVSRRIDFLGFDGAMLLNGVVEQSEIIPSPQTTTRYTYDARNALARVVVQAGQTVVRDLSYAYDGLGNMTSIADATGAKTIQFNHDKLDPDRICSEGPPGPAPLTCTYRYDASGAVRSVQGARSSFIYDGDGRVRSATVGARHATMTYGPFGALAELRVGNSQAERRESIFGAVSRVAFFDGGGDPTVVGPLAGGLQNYTDVTVGSPIGVVAAIRRSNTGARAILYPLGEAQGTRNVLGDNGSATQGIAYDPYGAVLSDTGDAATLTYFPYQWNGGHVLEGFGLVALGKRLLDNRTGRFLQRDPLANLSTSGAAHPYAFAWNNPASFVDRTGAEPQQSSDAGVSGSLGALGRMIQSHVYTPGPNVQPEIQTDWACDFDHNCMRAVEEGTGGLTEFEKGLKAEYHVTRKTSYERGPRYHVVIDKQTQAVLGYAFFQNSLEIYDRSGKQVSMISNEPQLETPTIDPIDFLGAGIASKIGKRFLGHGVRSAGVAIEEAAGRDAVEGAAAGGRARLPPWKWGSSTMTEMGTTSWAGDILINPTLKQGSADFLETLRHEGVHRFLSARAGQFAGSRQAAAKWFYHNSQLLKYTEEALAETVGTRSLAKGLALPFNPANYGINRVRLVLEGSAYAGLIYGSFRLGSFLGGDSDR